MFLAGLVERLQITLALLLIALAAWLSFR